MTEPGNCTLDIKDGWRDCFLLLLPGADVKANSFKFDNIKAEAIVDQLLTNAAGVRYGAVSVSAKMHDGRVVEVSYSRTEHTRDVEAVKEQKD